MSGKYTLIEVTELDRLRAEIKRLRQELATHKQLLREICEEWNENCDPECDSIAHTEGCKATNIASAKRSLLDRAERAEAALATARRDAERWNFVYPQLFINSEGCLCFVRNALYVGPKDGEWKERSKMEAAIDRVLAEKEGK